MSKFLIVDKGNDYEILEYQIVGLSRPISPESDRNKSERRGFFPLFAAAE